MSRSFGLEQFTGVQLQTAGGKMGGAVGGAVGGSVGGALGGALWSALGGAVGGASTTRRQLHSAGVASLSVAFGPAYVSIENERLLWVKRGSKVPHYLAALLHVTL